MKKLWMKHFLLCWSAAQFINIAQADLFKITDRAFTPGSIQDQALDLLESEVNKQNLPDANADTYLEGMANAGVTTSKGLGADYASNPSLFVVGGAIGVGADVGNNSFGDMVGGDIDANQLKGVGVNAAILGGINLGVFADELWIFDLHRANLYVNFMTMSDYKVDVLNLDFSSLGFHLQYKIIEPIDVVMGMFQWGGVDVTAGYEYASMDVSYSKDINQSRTVSGVTGNFTGTAKLNVESKTHSLPVEISTNARFLYFLSLYGGLGSDISWGEAKGSASVSGPVTVDGAYGGNASLNLGKNGSPDTFLLRGFAGLQFNIFMAKLFVQLNKGFTNDTIGLNTGLRVTW